MAEHAQRHLGEVRVARVLHDRGAAAALDRDEAGGAVVERAGEDDADGAAAERAGRGAEERVDRRPRQVLAGPRRSIRWPSWTRGACRAAPRRSSRPQRLAVLRMARGQGADHARSCGRMLCAPTCSTTATGAARSGGRPPTSVRSASTPPADAPMTITLRLYCGMARPCPCRHQPPARGCVPGRPAPTAPRKRRDLDLQIRPSGGYSRRTVASQSWASARSIRTEPKPRVSAGRPAGRRSRSRRAGGRPPPSLPRERDPPGVVRQRAILQRVGEELVQRQGQCHRLLRRQEHLGPGDRHPRARARRRRAAHRRQAG